MMQRLWASWPCSSSRTIHATHLCCFALLCNDACCCDQLDSVAQAGFVTNLGQQLACIICHLNILLLTPVQQQKCDIATRCIASALLVSADGAKSTVRALLKADCLCQSCKVSTWCGHLGWGEVDFKGEITPQCANCYSAGRACLRNTLLLLLKLKQTTVRPPMFSPDVQDLPDLLFAVGLSGDDQQPVQQVDGDAVRRPGHHSTPQRGTARQSTSGRTVYKT